MRRRVNFVVKPQLILFIVYMLISGVVLVFSTGEFVVDFKKIGFSVVSGVQTYTRNAAKFFANTFTAVKNLSTLQKEYDILVEKLADYENLQRSNAEIRKENMRLKSQLDFVETISRVNIPAQIIARDANNLYSAITINKGVRQGIRKDMPVIAFQEGNIGLVGKIIEVGPNTSMLIPIYDFQFNVSTRIQKTRELGLSTGSGVLNMGMIMSYVRKISAKDIQYGDLIVTSGENGNYDREIPVGIISNVNINDYSTTIDLEITPVIDFHKLESVVVISKELKDKA